MIKFKEISAYRALKEIYKHKDCWEFLLDFVESSEEIEEDDNGNIMFVYWDGKSTDHNYFTNEKDFFWIAGYEKNRVCFLQLMHRWSKFHIELVVAQKKKHSKVENIFGNLVEYIKNKQEKTKYLSTYPMNDRLKEYYKLNGFYDWKNELRLDLK